MKRPAAAAPVAVRATGRKFSVTDWEQYRKKNSTMGASTETIMISWKTSGPMNRTLELSFIPTSSYANAPSGQGCLRQHQMIMYSAFSSVIFTLTSGVALFPPNP
jgi:hypothetical protein